MASSLRNTLWNDPPSSNISLTRLNRRQSPSVFHPLPPISGSPPCTPAASLHSMGLSVNYFSDQERLPDICWPPCGEQLHDNCTTLTSITEPLPSNLSPPTWISTPPTPPKRASCLTRRRSVPRFSPFPSFSALLFPHAPDVHTRLPKRSLSLPAIRPSQYSTCFPSSTSTCDPNKGTSITSSDPDSGTALAISHNNNRGNKDLHIRPKPIFHILPEPTSENEDDGAGRKLGHESLQRSSTRGSQSTSESSSMGHSSQEKVDSQSTKDDIRRYHALMELLTTEVGYLMDLRALVNVYLRLIHTVASQSAGTRSSSTSFVPSSWSRVNTCPANDVAFSLSSSNEGLSVLVNGKEKEKGTPRFLFSTSEVETLARNAGGILQLHELFVEELRSAVTPLGFRMAFPEEPGGGGEENLDLPIGRVDAAIRAVATKFTTEASRFNSYELFCSGHPEALEIVRRVQNQHPAEWDIFEQLASSMISNLSHPFDCQAQGEPQPFENPGDDPTGQRDSKLTQSLDDPVRTLRTRTRLVKVGTAAPLPDTTLNGAKGRESTSRRLALMDYLIKPVQRICKYPLLLSQLASGKRIHNQDDSKWSVTGREVIRSDVNVIVESAMQAMRHVASAVDEARRRQDIFIQSSLIVSRISLATPLSAQCQPPATEQPQTLTATFLTSLGACLLAGSLDVMHYPASNDMVKAKYLGAFLYMGGYFVLVKVCKGKVYEPRHWFSLVDFELIDVEEEEAMLPCSFRLSCKGHHFELAAACRREKEAWMSSLRESITVPPTWTNEPISSLHLDGKGELVASTLEEPFEAIHSLPTIQSIPELGNNPEFDDGTVAPLKSDTIRCRPSLKLDIVTRADSPPYNAPPSRRSSTASVKAIFSPLSSDPETIVIRRSSPSARLQVDQGLQDVISAPCLTARSHASTHEEQLFQAPKITRSSFSRSNSGLSMAGAMGAAAKNRLTKHQSVRVPRRRSVMDGISTDPDGLPGVSNRRTVRARSLVSKRHARLTMTPMKRSAEEDKNQNGGAIRAPWDVLSESSTLISQCSSRSMSAPSSTLASPTLGPVSLPSSLFRRELAEASQQPDRLLLDHAVYRPKRTRSMVDSVRGLFQKFPRTTVSSDIHSSDHDAAFQATTTVTPGLLKRWGIGSLHRRVQSASDVPKDQSRIRLLPSAWMAPDTSEMPIVMDSDKSSVIPELEFGVSLTYTHASTAPPSHHTTLPSTSKKRRSLLTVSRLSPSSSPNSSDSGLQRKRSFLQWFKANDIS